MMRSEKEIEEELQNLFNLIRSKNVATEKLSLTLESMHALRWALKVKKDEELVCPSYRLSLMMVTNGHTTI